MRNSCRSQERNRCQSTDSNTSCIVSSILKKPSKFKLKHQRSVRFEEPDSSPQSETTNEHNTLSLQQGPLSPNSSFSINQSPQKSLFSNESPSSYLRSHRPKQSSQCIPDSYNQSPIKIITIAKQSKAAENKESPKEGQKTLKLECRDATFYNKLNYFLNAKSSLSPARVNPTVVNVKTKKPANLSVNQSFDSASVFSSPSSRAKLTKPGIPIGKKSPVKKSRSSGLNVLN
jgi:hypothetical protein